MPNAIDVTSPEFQMFLEHLNTNFPANILRLSRATLYHRIRDF